MLLLLLLLLVLVLVLLPLQVLLLLKGSDRVAHDLEQLQQLRSTPTEAPHQPQQQHQQDAGCQHEQASSDLQPDATTNINTTSSSRQPLPAQLVLRSWCALDHEWQFRAFVCSHRVVAISQRDPSQHFPQLASAAAAAEDGRHSLASIKQRLVAFHSEHIGSSFALDSCEQFVVGCYLSASLVCEALWHSACCCQYVPVRVCGLLYTDMQVCLARILPMPGWHG
jgi:hypothetical protein